MFHTFFCFLQRERGEKNSIGGGFCLVRSFFFHIYYVPGGMSLRRINKRLISSVFDSSRLITSLLSEISSSHSFGWAAEKLGEIWHYTFFCFMKHATRLVLFLLFIWNAIRTTNEFPNNIKNRTYLQLSVHVQIDRFYILQLVP